MKIAPNAYTLKILYIEYFNAEDPNPSEKRERRREKESDPTE